jgi:hypothetical protein
MKWKHILFIGLALVGVLYVVHNYQMHGGVSGIKSGLGFGGMSGGMSG